MSSIRSKEVRPRNGHTLVVGIVARISGCAKQKDVSLEDQIQHAQELVATLFDGKVDYQIVSTKGKGERIDRPELVEIERMIRSGELDLLIVEDLGRLVRGTEASRLCGIAKDRGTRVISPNDCIDTDDESWEEDVISACRDHVGHNSHTSKRLKKKLMLRFKRSGGATPLPITGYVKPEDAKTFFDWRKDDTLTPMIRDGFDFLMKTKNCSAVADLFNEKKMPLGPYCRSERWDGAMVRRFFRNPLLKGSPGRGFRHSIKIHETGRRICVRTEEGPSFIECGHLAHLSAAEFDELNLMLTDRNSVYQRGQKNGKDVLHDIPRKRTRFPGQHVKCWYCGREYTWGGHGNKHHLQCKGSKSWNCWNSSGLDGKLLATKLVKEITRFLVGLESFGDQFTTMVQASIASRQQVGQHEHTKIARDIAKLEIEQRHLTDAIAAYGPRDSFQLKLKELDGRFCQLFAERARLNRFVPQTVNVPTSFPEFRNLLENRFLTLSEESFEFSIMMKQIVPDIHVFLVRSCDGGHLLPRARVKVNLLGAIADELYAAEIDSSLTQTFFIDVFEPTQREAIRGRVIELHGQGMSQRTISKSLPEYATQPVVQRAIALNEMMKRLGLTSPYVFQNSPPSDYATLRSHLNRRYAFRQADGYQAPQLPAESPD
jgi:hypothetical protein